MAAASFVETPAEALPFAAAASDWGTAALGTDVASGTKSVNISIKVMKNTSKLPEKILERW